MNLYRKEPKMANLTTEAGINGTIKFGQAMRIDGNVEGELITDNGELFVGKMGKVKARVKVRSAIIEGRVDGNIEASDRVELKQNAYFIGELHAKTLIVEKGVVFVGKCNVNPAETKKESQRYKNITKEERVEQIIFNRFINE